VGLGKAGIVMGLEVSRLARNCADWHRLLETTVPEREEMEREAEEKEGKTEGWHSFKTP
jgi:DNA invertase Pin-like site-specific DNA recombinase